VGAIAAPIRPGKLALWEAFMAELNGPRQAECHDMNRRFGLTEHRWWLQQMPDGYQIVFAVHDGPGAIDFMGKLATSENLFDLWVLDTLEEAHGFDFSGPLPPLAQRRL